MVLEIGSRQRGHGCDVWGWLDMESWEMALKAGWEVEPNAEMTWHERSWQIMKAWNETRRWKTVLAMNFHPLFLPEPANNDLKNWYTIFSEADEFPCCQNEKLPLNWHRAFTSFFGLTGCNLQLRCTDMAKSYAWYLWHWSNVPKHRHGGQGRRRNGRVFGVLLFFFSFFMV